MEAATVSTPTEVPAGWQRVERPASLFQRFEFSGYPATRKFLQDLEQLSKQHGLYPDLGFGPRHANVTVHLDASSESEAAAFAFATAASALARAVQENA